MALFPLPLNIPSQISFVNLSVYKPSKLGTSSCLLSQTVLQQTYLERSTKYILPATNIVWQHLRLVFKITFPQQPSTIEYKQFPFEAVMHVKMPENYFVVAFSPIIFKTCHRKDCSRYPITCKNNLNVKHSRYIVLLQVNGSIICLYLRRELNYVDQPAWDAWLPYNAVTLNQIVPTCALLRFQRLPFQMLMTLIYLLRMYLRSLIFFITDIVTYALLVFIHET